MKRFLNILWLVLALVVILGVVFGIVRLVRWIDDPAVTIERTEDATTVTPRNPIIDPDPEDAVFADTSGRITKVRISNSKTIVGTVTVYPDSTEDPARLIVDLKPVGWFPELTGRDRRRVGVRSLGGTEAAVYVPATRPVFQFEFRPIIGAMFNPATNSGTNKANAAAGISLARIGPIHIGPVVGFPSWAYGGAGWVAVRDRLWIGAGPMIGTDGVGFPGVHVSYSF